MKLHLSWFLCAAVLLGVAPAVAATNSGTRAASSVDLTSAPAVRERTQVNYEKYETRTTQKTYDEADARNLYYVKPADRGSLYKQYAGNSDAVVRKTRAETYRSELRRKYYLAHPFFQPLKGDFGSVTDLSYTINSYDFSVSGGANEAAKWDMSRFSIKEDFSYGITDRLAVLAMLQYDISNYKFDWAVSTDDTMDDNGFNLMGVGLQWRFVDTSDWIATVSGYYQYQPDMSNNVILDIKGGYKVASSTIYALARGWYVDFAGTSYGNGITGTTSDGVPSTMFIAYKTDVNNVFYAEGGLGVFSVLDEDWTLNVEALFGYYDWHNQASIKAAIGWQPNDWFALNLYGKMAVYDTADGKDLSFWGTDTQQGSNSYGQYVYVGPVHTDNYSEATVGLQAVFSF